MRFSNLLLCLLWTLPALVATALASCGGSDEGARRDASMQQSDAAIHGPAVGCPQCVTLVGGKVFDGSDATAATVVVEGSTIRKVMRTEEVRVTAGETLDVSGMTVLPGLVDMHVHSSASAGPRGYRSRTDTASNHFKAMVRAGVTSQLDLGSSADWIFTHRARQRNGRLLAPRIFAAGPLFTAPGGHPCYEGQPPEDFCELLSQPSDVPEAFSRVQRHEPDIIKAVVEAGTPFRTLPRMGQQTLSALVERANEADQRVVVHVSKPEDVRIALDAGARVFAHMPSGGALSESLVERLVEQDAVVIPTLAVVDALHRLAQQELSELDDSDLERDVDPGVIDALQNPQFVGFMRSSEYRDWARTRLETAKRNFRKCMQAGVRMVAGTDAGNPGVFFGLSMHRELALYVEQGMDPAQALRLATEDAARFLGRDDLGTVTAGAHADLTVVQGDPTEDIDALSDVRYVLRDGDRVGRESLALTEDRRLLTSPASGKERGEGCLASEECASGLGCRYDARCSAPCNDDSGCAEGAICVQSGSSQRMCLEGDDCDLMAQDCENGAACIWAGHGSTFCWAAGDRTAGESCSTRQPCAPGFMCFGQGGAQCERLCDPAATDPECPDDQSCESMESLAGLAIGHCR